THATFTLENLDVNSCTPAGIHGETVYMCRDRVTNSLEGFDNCPTIANPGQEDTDGDYIGNACDGDYSSVPVLLGDVDGDTTITLNDAILIAQIALGVSIPDTLTIDDLDLDCDTRVTLDDAILVAQVALGAPDIVSCG
ncbi:hypothetical protein HOC32_01255, partial [Candidatus Woesearchaeota archaeon]|nr:hypothetical protein [Candidatus Woesearchaeota archaeon]